MIFILYITMLYNNKPVTFPAEFTYYTREACEQDAAMHRGFPDTLRAKCVRGVN